MHKDGKVYTVAHRCSESVREVTMLMFDADEGTEADVEACDGRLEGVARCWYTSHSYGAPAKGSLAPYRLAIPITAPIRPEAFHYVRSKVLEHFKIPAHPTRSSGLCHSYYLPACPPDAQPKTRVGVGDPLDVSLIASAVPARVRLNLPAFEMPEEPTEPVDIEPYRKALRARLARLSFEDEEKAELLRRCLEGEALAGHGGRRNALVRVAGIIVFALPEDVPLSVLHYFLKDSVDAMIDEGSSVTHQLAQTNLLSSMRSRFKKSAEAAYYDNHYQKAAGRK